MEEKQNKQKKNPHKQKYKQTKPPKNIESGKSAIKQVHTWKSPQSALFALGLKGICDFFVHNHKIQTTTPNHKTVTRNRHTRPPSSSCSPYYPLEKVPTFLLSHSDSLPVCTWARPETEEGMSRSRHWTKLAAYEEAEKQWKWTVNILTCATIPLHVYRFDTK